MKKFNTVGYSNEKSTKRREKEVERSLEELWCDSGSHAIVERNKSIILFNWINDVILHDG